MPLAASLKKEGELCARPTNGSPGLDDCDKGLFCSLVRAETGKNPELRCRRHCEGLLDAACSPGEVCVPSATVVGPQNNSALCRPRCTFPAGPECGPGARCSFVGNGCIATVGLPGFSPGYGAINEECLSEGDCQTGLACDGNRCVPTCDPPNRTCPEGYRCSIDEDAGVPDAGGSSALCLKL